MRTAFFSASISLFVFFNQLQKNRVLIPGESLYISSLKTTPEGLQEYWIQWKNKEIQAECKN